MHNYVAVVIIVLGVNRLQSIVRSLLTPMHMQCSALLLGQGQGVPEPMLKSPE